MASKNTRTRIPVPIKYCYRFLHKAVDGVPGWNIIDTDHKRHSVMYRHRANVMTNPVTVTVSLSPIGDGQTHMIVTAHNDAAFDPFGILDRALKDFMRHFEAKMPHLIEEVEAAIRGGISSGHLCPKCGLELPPGARFCPRDGTAVAIECKKCGQANIPDASFCINCGGKL
jgi:ribosomal protein L40E